MSKKNSSGVKFSDLTNNVENFECLTFVIEQEFKDENRRSELKNNSERKEKIVLFLEPFDYKLKESSRTKLSRLWSSINVSIEMVYFKSQHVINILHK
jgi:hypothetical protein